MANIAELKQIIKKNEAGQWWEDYGPLKIGTANVYEIWTVGDDDDPEGRVSSPEVRFWLEGKGGEEKYFEWFSALAEHLDEQCTSAAREGADVDLAKERQAEEAYRKRFSLWVASAGFLIAVVTICALALRGNTTTAVILALAGLASSGGYLFFGGWRLPHETTRS